MIMKKTFSILGLLGGIAVIVLGSLAFSGEMGETPSSASSSSYLYDSGFAIFGLDSYTYMNNNAAEAANAARITANNQRDIAEILKNAGVILILSVGFFMFCFFGVKLSECRPGRQPVRQTTNRSPASGQTGKDRPGQHKGRSGKRRGIRDSAMLIPENVNKRTGVAVYVTVV